MNNSKIYFIIYYSYQWNFIPFIISFSKLKHTIQFIKYIENSARKREKNISNSMNVSVAVCNSVEDERRKLRPREEHREGKKKGGKKRQGRRRLGRYTIWVSASVVGSDAVRCWGSVTWRRNCYAMSIKDNSHLPFQFLLFILNLSLLIIYIFFNYLSNNEYFLLM